MHIPPFNNKNKPIVDMDDKNVPLNYFNIVKLNKDQVFEYQTPGYHSVFWQVDNHPSGMYFVKMHAGNYISTQKIMLLK